jgi:hypothetical protein
MKSFKELKFWFMFNYGNLGYHLTDYYIDVDHKQYFYISQYEDKLGIPKINMNTLLDITNGDMVLMKTVFNTLIRHRGYEIDFKPIKKINNFKL